MSDFVASNSHEMMCFSTPLRLTHTHMLPCSNPLPLPPRYMLSLSPTWTLQEPMQINQPVRDLHPAPRPEGSGAPVHVRVSYC